jgi:serine/threonine protein kinase
VLKGVETLHSAGITHYDLKCDNIFIKKDTNDHYSVIIGDFGESTIEDVTSKQKIKNKGTECIKAPELLTIGSES